MLTVPGLPVSCYALFHLDISYLRLHLASLCSSCQRHWKEVRIWEQQLNHWPDGSVFKCNYLVIKQKFL